MSIDIVDALRTEASVSEELHPDDSEIQVMRDAADEIERLRKLVPVEPAPWANVHVDAHLLAEVFDAFCGADGYNLVVKIAIERLNRPTS